MQPNNTPQGLPLFGNVWHFEIAKFAILKCLPVRGSPKNVAKMEGAWPPSIRTKKENTAVSSIRAAIAAQSETLGGLAKDVVRKMHGTAGGENFFEAIQDGDEDASGTDTGGDDDDVWMEKILRACARDKERQNQLCRAEAEASMHFMIDTPVHIATSDI